MIGNDIVDLQLASNQSNWRRSGWLQKVFTTTEQQYIHASENPNLMVWKLWSMKEATYKANQQRFSHEPRYNPWEFQCTLDGKVHVENYVYTLTTKVAREYIYSIANEININYSSKLFINEPHLKHQLKLMIAYRFEENLSSVLIKKNGNNIPIVYINNKEIDIQISLTHHGKFSAFVMNL